MNSVDKTIVVNKKEEPYDVYIGRGSIFGNPFTHLPLEGTKAEFRVATREKAIWAYEKWFVQQLKDEQFKKQVLALEGKRLGCFCKPLVCHGDVIVRWLAQQHYESSGLAYIDASTPCPECGGLGWNYSRKVGEVCQMCKFKNAKITIHDYYMNLAAQAFNDNWRDYFVRMADWDKADCFQVSSADNNCPIFIYFSQVSGVDAKQIYANNGFEDPSPAVYWCSYNCSFYIGQGFTGGCLYKKVVL